MCMFNPQSLKMLKVGKGGGAGGLLYKVIQENQREQDFIPSCVRHHTLYSFSFDFFIHIFLQLFTPEKEFCLAVIPDVKTDIKN